MNPEPGGTPLNVGWPARVIRLARSLSVDEHSVKKQEYFLCFLCLLALDQLHTSGCLTDVGVLFVVVVRRRAGGRAGGAGVRAAVVTSARHVAAAAAVCRRVGRYDDAQTLCLGEPVLVRAPTGEGGGGVGGSPQKPEGKGQASRTPVPIVLVYQIVLKGIAAQEMKRSANKKNHTKKNRHESDKPHKKNTHTDRSRRC